MSTEGIQDPASSSSSSSSAAAAAAAASSLSSSSSSSSSISQADGGENVEDGGRNNVPVAAPAPALAPAPAPAPLALSPVQEKAEQVLKMADEVEANIESRNVKISQLHHHPLMSSTSSFETASLSSVVDPVSIMSSSFSQSNIHTDAAGAGAIAAASSSASSTTTTKEAPEDQGDPPSHSAGAKNRNSRVQDQGGGASTSTSTSTSTPRSKSLSREASPKRQPTTMELKQQLHDCRKALVTMQENANLRYRKLELQMIDLQATLTQTQQELKDERTKGNDLKASLAHMHEQMEHVVGKDRAAKMREWENAATTANAEWRRCQTLCHDLMHEKQHMLAVVNGCARCRLKIRPDPIPGSFWSSVTNVLKDLSTEQTESNNNNNTNTNTGNININNSNSSNSTTTTTTPNNNNHHHHFGSPVSTKPVMTALPSPTDNHHHHHHHGTSGGDASSAVQPTPQPPEEMYLFQRQADQISQQNLSKTGKIKADTQGKRRDIMNPKNNADTYTHSYSDSNTSPRSSYSQHSPFKRKGGGGGGSKGSSMRSIASALPRLPTQPSRRRNDKPESSSSSSAKSKRDRHRRNGTLDTFFASLAPAGLEEEEMDEERSFFSLQQRTAPIPSTRSSGGSGSGRGGGSGSGKKDKSAKKSKKKSRRASHHHHGKLSSSASSKSVSASSDTDPSNSEKDDLEEEEEEEEESPPSTPHITNTGLASLTLSLGEEELSQEESFIYKSTRALMNPPYSSRQDDHLWADGAAAGGGEGAGTVSSHRENLTKEVQEWASDAHRTTTVL